MKISAQRPLYKSNNKHIPKQQSFGNGGEPLLNLLRAAEKESRSAKDVFNKIKDNNHDVKIPKAIKAFYNLGDSNPEIASTVINGIGTALVAPFFIVYNPMSKKDKSTREYSAMRQPLSAIIAVGAQLGLNKQYFKAIDKLVAKGELGFKKDKKYFPKTEEQETKLLNELKAEFEQKGEAKTEEQLLKVIEERKFIKNPAYDMSRFNDKKNLTADPDELIEKVKSELNIKTETKKLSDEEKNKIAKAIEERKLPEFKALVKEYTGLSEEQALVKAQNLLTHRMVKNETKIHVEINIYEDMNQKLKNMFKENPGSKIACRTGEFFKNIKDNLIEYPKYNSQTPKEIYKNTIKELKEHLKDFDELEQSKVFNELKNKKKSILFKAEQNSELTEKQIYQKLVNVEALKLKELTENKAGTVVLDVLENQINHVKGNVKNFKAMTGIAFAVATLPITCGILNWVYPRFMELAFPNLANAKKGAHNESK